MPSLHRIFRVLFLPAALTRSQNINDVQMFKRSSFRDLTGTIKVGTEIEKDVVFVGSGANDNLSSVKWNLPVGRAVVLLEHFRGSDANDDVVLKQKTLDLIGTGRSESCDFSNCVNRRGMNDKIGSYFWTNYDVDIGYVVLYEHPYRSSSWGGNSKSLFLSNFKEDTVISMSGWYMADKADAIRATGKLGRDIQIEFFEHSFGTGKKLTIQGWKTNLNKNELSPLGMGDNISSFRWSTRPTPAPVPSPTRNPTPVPTPQPTGSAVICESSTKILMEKIHSDYNDIDVTETVISGTNDIFVDFSTNTRFNAVYADACRQYQNDEGVVVGGNYQELHYQATCSNLDQGIVDETIIVSGHPRCYASICEEEDQQSLLQDFAIQLMQDRANEVDAGWVCTGQESNVQFSGPCDFETQVLNDATNLKLALDALDPSVESEKLFGFIPFNLQAQVVEFPDSSQSIAEYEKACLDSGGITKDKNIQALCTETAAGLVDVPHRIEKYPVCLAPSCEFSDSTSEDAAALVSFVSFMKFKTKFGTSATCEVSDAGVGSGVSMAVIAVVGALLGSLVLL